ncbi:hypothetical protein VTP01DRAFT_2994 [Rhizomucor pusillus]|uniref:uncharacterized protein n=1 Tax=Rhizomucor pusillus TaxID=4840 RepID=UPI0037436304
MHLPSTATFIPFVVFFFSTLPVLLNSAFATSKSPSVEDTSCKSTFKVPFVTFEKCFITCTICLKASQPVPSLVCWYKVSSCKETPALPNCLHFGTFKMASMTTELKTIDDVPLRRLIPVLQCVFAKCVQF